MGDDNQKELIDAYDFCSLNGWKKQQKKLQDEFSDTNSFDFECQ